MKNLINPFQPHDRGAQCCQRHGCPSLLGTA